MTIFLNSAVVSCNSADNSAASAPCYHTNGKSIARKKQKRRSQRIRRMAAQKNYIIVREKIKLSSSFCRKK